MCACGVSVWVCACGVGVGVYIPRHKSNTNLNVVAGSTVLPTGPTALHAATDAATPFTLCTTIHGEFAHLPSLLICCAHRTKSKVS